MWEKLWRTQETDLDTDGIEEYIELHQKHEVPELDALWEYYCGRNPYILKRAEHGDSPRIKSESESTFGEGPGIAGNNPTNRTPVSYGRKIVTTFAGYAYRPRYITYKSELEPLMQALQETFNFNNEHIKTSRAGRNTGIFGKAYEWVYIEGRDATRVGLCRAEVLLSRPAGNDSAL